MKMVSKQRIGLAKVEKGFYIIINQFQVLGDDQVRLFHKQLRHPSIHTANKMFPNKINSALKF